MLNLVSLDRLEEKNRRITRQCFGIDVILFLDLQYAHCFHIKFHRINFLTICFFVSFHRIIVWLFALIGRSPPPSTCDAACEYYVADDRLDYLFKFLIIGSAGSGKSCLLHHFIENKCKYCAETLSSSSKPIQSYWYDANRLWWTNPKNI